MRQLLCHTYSRLRDRVVMTVDEWIGDSGEFLVNAWLSKMRTSRDSFRRVEGFGLYELEKGWFEES